MSKAHLARTTIGILGFVATCLSISAVKGAAWTIGVMIAGFVISSALAEWAFRATATPEELRKDLDDRARADD